MSVVGGLEAGLAKLAILLLRLLGPARASDFGGALARAIGPLLPVSRVADDNLRLAMPELDAAARRRMVRGVWENLGRTVGEFPHLGALHETAGSAPGWEITGREVVDALLVKGGPAIFFSAHIGNWEILPPIAASHGIELASLYRAASNAAMDGMIRDLRRLATGVRLELFAKGSAGARQAFAHLRGGGFLGLLVDQKLNDGIEARFFGRSAMTAPAVAVFALKLRCPVIPAHVERLAPARLRLVLGQPLYLPDTGNRQADIAALTQTVNDHVEAWVRQRPDQWLWLHRRWPNTSPRKDRPEAKIKNRVE